MQYVVPVRRTRRTTVLLLYRVNPSSCTDETKNVVQLVQNVWVG